MDRISESLLNEFSKEHGIEMLPQDKRFEHLAAHVVTHRHYSKTFESGDLVTGAGGDNGMDSISIIVNGVLITELGPLQDIIDMDGDLDVTFVFVQAERSSSFDGAKIMVFGQGVYDFFSETKNTPRNERITEFAEIQAEIFKHFSKFISGNPRCCLYYMTTGKWQDEATLVGRIETVKADLEALGLFREVTFTPVDAAFLQRLYQQTKNAIQCTFTFKDRVALPDIPDVKEAHLGYLDVPSFLKLIQDDSGNIINSLFYDNVRDYIGDAQVNEEIRATVASEARARFVLMNNGVTIIARKIQNTGNKFSIADYSIVNGCQTSHVLVREQGKIDSSVFIPIRLIGTQNEEVINDIIKATNRQTAIEVDQFYALEEFPKALERYFDTFPPAQKLFFERRDEQYANQHIEKTRVVTMEKAIKAYSAMFLSDPHTATRTYSSTRAKIGKEIFAKGHRMEPYYTASAALYKLEYYFRNMSIESKYKPARFHIIYCMRLLAGSAAIPRPNSHDMERYCKALLESIWDAPKCEALVAQAIKIVEKATEGNFHRDMIRTEALTTRIATLAGNGFDEIRFTKTLEPAGYMEELPFTMSDSPSVGPTNV